MMIIQEIERRADSGEYMTQGEILDWINLELKHRLNYTWISHFLERHSGTVMRAIVHPQEDPRLQVPRTWLNRYLALITKIVPLASCELIFNMDETGLSDWEERRAKGVVVPTTLQGRRLHFGVSRKNRHETLLCTISASGDAYLPLLIAAEPRVCELFELRPIRKNIDLSLEIRASPYVDADIFRRYIHDVFIPIVESERNGMAGQENPAILFFDNCRAHCQKELLAELARLWVIVITYPPHTSGIFQVLDRLVFGVLKVAKRGVSKDIELVSVIDHARRVFVAYERATCSETIRGSWGHTGFDYVKIDGIWHLTVNGAKIQNLSEFTEVWNRDFKEDDMTPGQRNQVWGWVNKEFFPEWFQGRVDQEFQNRLYIYVSLQYLFNFHIDRN
jgi:hypothetical protein